LNSVGLSQLSSGLKIFAAVPPSEPRFVNVTGSGDGTISIEWISPKDFGGARLVNYYVYY